METCKRKGETMTNIEKVNKALKNADESKVKEVLDFLGYKDDGKFIPEIGEKYYFITGLGQFSFQNWKDDKYDNYVLLMNNVYRTREEVEHALDLQVRKAKLIKEIENSSDVIDWGDEDQYKYYIWLDVRFNALRVDNNSYAKTQGTIHTTNEQFLEELIATRADEVRELLFGVK